MTDPASLFPPDQPLRHLEKFGPANLDSTDSTAMVAAAAYIRELRAAGQAISDAFGDAPLVIIEGAFGKDMREALVRVRTVLATPKTETADQPEAGHPPHEAPMTETHTPPTEADVQEEMQKIALKKLLSDDPAAFEAKVRRLVDAGELDSWDRETTTSILIAGADSLGVHAPSDLWERVAAPLAA